MAAPLKVISSMATRQLLIDLVAAYHATTSARADVESVGGVDAARRVQAGEAFDVVVLAAPTIDKLAVEGHVVAGSRRDLVTSGVAVAVRSGAARPLIDDEEALKHAVLAAKTVSFSTGPSGVHINKLFARWGITDALQGRIVEAAPGVPVGSLIASGKVELGFQQLSELLHLDGIDVIGPLPPTAQIITTFSAGLASTSARAVDVAALLAFLTSPAAMAAKHRNGMEPVA